MNRRPPEPYQPRLQLRSYRDGDHDAVWELHNLALNQIGAHGGNGAWDDDLHSIQKVYFEPGGYFVVGLLEDTVVAMGAMKRTDQNRGEIKRMRVHPNCQRRGFGQQVLDYLEGQAQKLGVSHLHLETTTQQPAAMAFYMKNGYRESARKEGPIFTLVSFEKPAQPLPSPPARKEPGL